MPKLVACFNIYLLSEMDIKTELLKAHSSENAEKIALYIFGNHDKLVELYKLFWENDYRITQRATLVIIICTQRKPKMVLPFVEEMILKLYNNDLKNSIKRNTVRILSELTIPKHLEGHLTEICFNFLNNVSEAIAVQVFSMTILERIIEKYPELKSELIATLEKGMEFSSAGYRSRGSKILMRLRKNK